MNDRQLIGYDENGAMYALDWKESLGVFLITFVSMNTLFALVNWLLSYGDV